MFRLSCSVENLKKEERKEGGKEEGGRERLWNTNLICKKKKEVFRQC